MTSGGAPSLTAEIRVDEFQPIVGSDRCGAVLFGKDEAAVMLHDERRVSLLKALDKKGERRSFRNFLLHSIDDDVYCSFHRLILLEVVRTGGTQDFVPWV